MFAANLTQSCWRRTVFGREVRVMVFNPTFNKISVILTCHKSLTNLIT